MNRRALLAAGISVAATAAAGCLGSDSDAADEPVQEYDSCSLSVVSYERLPSAVKSEVDVAFDEGSYHHDNRLLWAQIDDGIEALYDAPGHSSNDYFEPIAEQYDERHHLRFEETTVTNPFVVDIVNETGEPIAGSITVERDPVLTTESFDISDEASEQIEVGGVALGEYDVQLSYDDGTEASAVVENNYYDAPLGSPQVIVEPDDISVVRPPDDGGRRAPCSWDSEGTG